MEFLNNIGNWFIGVGNSILDKIVPFCLIVGIGILENSSVIATVWITAVMEDEASTRISS